MILAHLASVAVGWLVYRRAFENTIFSSVRTFMMHQVFVVYPIRISEGDLGPWQDTIKVYVPFIEKTTASEISMHLDIFVLD